MKIKPPASVPDVSLYFQVHQPNRLIPYDFFRIGEHAFYEDDVLNAEILSKVSEKCYLPANAMFEKLLKKEFFLPDQWCAQETYQVMLKSEIWVHTKGIDAATLERFHFRSAPDLNLAITELLVRFGQKARWAIVPDGPLLILKRDE